MYCHQHFTLVIMIQLHRQNVPKKDGKLIEIFTDSILYSKSKKNNENHMAAYEICVDF